MLYWLLMSLGELSSHLIGLNEQQSPLFGTRLAKLLGGSQVSNISGDNLGVDKSALSRLEHFWTVFVFVFFYICKLCPGKTLPVWITYCDSSQTPLPHERLGLTVEIRTLTRHRGESGTLLFKAS